MANYRKYYGQNWNRKRKRKKYTTAEQIAFRLGQEKKVRNSIASGKTETRVYDAFIKGLSGMPQDNKNKPLY